jgi:YbbR domain-containing protein
MSFTIPPFIKQDLPRKIVAIFFASLSWLVVRSQLQEYEIFHGVPVTLQYDSATLSVENENPVTVDITLRGSRKLLQKTQASNIRIVAPIQVPKGVFFYDLRLSPRNIDTPPGTRASDITPDKVRIPVDRIVTKHNVPIRIRYAGELQEGYKIARSTTFPSVAEIRGPSKILRDVRELVTEPIPLDKTLSHDFEIDARLQPVPQTHLNIESVHVAIEITRHTTQKSYHHLPIRVLSGADAGRQPRDPLPEVSVTIQGPIVTLSQLENVSVKPFIDISQITSPGQYRRPVQVWVDGSPNVTAEYVHPSVVEITLIDSAAAPKAKASPPQKPASASPAP